MRRNRQTKQKRAGAIAALAGVMMTVMAGLLAFSVDVGYIYTAKTELERSADAAALAAAGELLEQSMNSGDSSGFAAAIATEAATYAGYNKIGGDSPSIGADDITLGRISNPNAFSGTIDTSATSSNAVKVRVRRTAEQNGGVGLFFAKALGYDTCSLQGEATAMFIDNFTGFQTPCDGSNLKLLPFALDEVTWDALVNGEVDSDDWCWNEDGTITPASGGVGDGEFEVNLFPQGTGSPGNRGTVDIGSSNNSTNDIARQIVDGISAEDLAYMGGSICLDENGELELNGDTGISAGVKDELASIKGQPRIIPIFRSVTGPGNNAQYTIVAYQGVRIMNVKLTGKMTSKEVIIQRADITVTGGIPGSGPPTSDSVYSPVWLVR